MNESYVIGTIDFSDCYSEMEEFNRILDEAQIGKPIEFKGRLGECTVNVEPNEGPKPHVHIKSNDKNMKICIRLDKPEFFKHGKNDEILKNKKEMEKFNEFMKSTNYKKETMWELAVKRWNDSNPKYKIDSSIEQPDYSTITLNK